jgi:hypothetical protein
MNKRFEQINGDLKKKILENTKKKKVKEKKRTNNRQDNRGRITGKRKSKGEKEKDLNL